MYNVSNGGGYLGEKSIDPLICPLFNFELDELYGNHYSNKKLSAKFLDQQNEKYRIGFKLSENVTLRLPTCEELTFF